MSFPGTLTLALAVLTLVASSVLLATHLAKGPPIPARSGEPRADDEAGGPRGRKAFEGAETSLGPESEEGGGEVRGRRASSSLEATTA